MKAFIKIASCAMVCLGLTVGAAYAGSLSSNPKTVAIEIVPSTANSSVTLNNATNNAPISYQPGVNMVTGNIVKFTMTGAKFGAVSGHATYAICNGNTTLARTTTDMTAASATIELTAQDNILGSSLYALSYLDSFNADPCGQTETTTIPVVIPSSTTLSSTVSVSAESVGVAGGNATAVTLYTFASQFSGQLFEEDSTISFTNGMKGFKADSNPSNVPYATSSASKAGLLILSNEAINNKVATGLADNTTCATATGLAVGDVTLEVTVTGTFTEVLKTTGGVTVESATNNVNSEADSAVTSTTTSAKVSVRGDTLKICGTGASETSKNSARRAITITVDGTSALVSREFDSAAVLKAGTQTADPTAVVVRDVTLFSASTSHVWNLDKSMAVVPYLHTASTVPTYCMVSNTSSSEAEVELDILSSETGTVTDDDLDIDEIPAHTTKLYTFSGTTVTPKGGTAMSLGLGDNVRYSARFSIMAPPNQVFFNCIQQDPGTNVKRMVPVLTQDYNADVSWKN